MRYHRWYSPWLLVIPALGLVTLFSIWPAINTGVLSFTNVRQITGGRFVGFSNYIAMFQDPQLLNALINTLLYVVICVPLLTVLPLLLAILVQRTIPLIGLFRTVFYFPVVASAVVVAVIWQWLLDSRGLVNGLLQDLHLTQQAVPFLTGRWLLLFSAISLTVWKGLGYYMIIYLSALANVPQELHEAAAVDGAGGVRRFFAVTLPGVRATTMLVAILVMISAMRIFTELYILGGRTGGIGGNDSSIVLLIQNAASGINARLGYASTLSVFLFAITVIPMLVLSRLNRRAEA
ncbi:MAG TPA: sugar ABC transporter permease [Pseudonocardiaceae bacterium]|nr:sugar ABC transporter permease [Pseudonocardiaceae bacterium]